MAEKRFRYLATVQKGHLPRFLGEWEPNTEIVPYLTMDYLRGETTEPTLVAVEPGLLLADEGDTLLLWDGSNAGEFLHSKRGVVSSTIALITPTTVDPAYFYWVCKTLEGRVRSETIGMGIPHVNGEFLANLRVMVPSRGTQRVIADYLERETPRIDALIAAKERLFGLLAEKRRAVITRAVIRGLDPNVPLRNSGIPWLGEIPAHWEIVALRFLVDLSSGATPNTGKPEYWDGEIPWVSPKDMKQTEITDAQDHVSDLALSESTLHLIDPGAVLIVVRGMILAHSFPTAVNTKSVTINQDMKALRCLRMIEPYFLRDFFLGNEERIVSLADSSAHGTRKLETEVLGRLEVLVPPRDEQLRIVAYIKEAIIRLDTLQSATEVTISLLRERRAALIAETVTGQIKEGGKS